MLEGRTAIKDSKRGGIRDRNRYWKRRWHLEANPRGALVNVGREREKGGREGKRE